MALRECPHSDTLPFVRCSPIPPWFMICVLVARLVLGELAHAMPMPPETGAPNATLSSGAAACPQHTHASEDSAAQTDQHSQHQKPAAPSKDCCKSGGCLCLHASVIVAALPMIAPASLDRGTAMICTPGLVHPRIDRLFRPPA